ncbi:MAG: branched-chain amino acid ABC transporter permease [Anaerolineae bacterium]|nr:MAG: branched-chain amino acid ABC transporter permease [Anaerolineae bacterium]
MQSAIPNLENRQNRVLDLLKANSGLIAVFLILLAFPFIVALLNGQSFSAVLNNETGNAKFLQGLMIEVFILGVYAISYDLILGVTGLLSFGQAMFFAVGAYVTGIAFKKLGLGIWATIGLVVVAGVIQALLFAVVLPRVKGITFALVTLGFASVFFIVVKTNELKDYTGADVGLQGVIAPAFLDTNKERFVLYIISLCFALVVYLVYRRFVDSPTGRVCIAIRDNEDRALMLGYNTFTFKLVVLIIASITAALAGGLHAIHQPIVSPNIASLAFTVAALLIILIGGIGTLTGAYVGAIVFRLLQFYLDKWFGEGANFLLGLVYVLLVLFIPYGIVGTWRVHSFRVKQGRQYLARLLSGGAYQPVDAEVEE